VPALLRLAELTTVRAIAGELDESACFLGPLRADLEARGSSVDIVPGKVLFAPSPPDIEVLLDLVVDWVRGLLAVAPVARTQEVAP
jgi:hypothetical protein